MLTTLRNAYTTLQSRSMHGDNYFLVFKINLSENAFETIFWMENCEIF